ncbi:hypothetical protein AB1N83_012389 [Pleurotus pulmonarius]
MPASGDDESNAQSIHGKELLEEETIPKRMPVIEGDFYGRGIYGGNFGGGGRYTTTNGYSPRMQNNLSAPQRPRPSFRIEADSASTNRPERREGDTLDIPDRKPPSLGFLSSLKLFFSRGKSSDVSGGTNGDTDTMALSGDHGEPSEHEQGRGADVTNRPSLGSEACTGEDKETVSTR